MILITTQLDLHMLPVQPSEISDNAFDAKLAVHIVWPNVETAVSLLAGLPSVFAPQPVLFDIWRKDEEDPRSRAEVIAEISKLLRCPVAIGKNDLNMSFEAMRKSASGKYVASERFFGTLTDNDHVLQVYNVNGEYRFAYVLIAGRAHLKYNL